MMGEIYSKIGQVDVFLGLADEESDIAVQAVKDLFAALVPAMMAKLNGSTDRMAIDHYDHIAEDVTSESSIRCDTVCKTNKCSHHPRVPIRKVAWYISSALVSQSMGIPRSGTVTEGNLLLR